VDGFELSPSVSMAVRGCALQLPWLQERGLTISEAFLEPLGRWGAGTVSGLTCLPVHAILWMGDRCILPVRAVRATELPELRTRVLRTQSASRFV